MSRSWLSLVWYKSSSRCPVSRHGQVTPCGWMGEEGGIHKMLGIITSLSLCGVVQCGITSAKLFNKSCRTSKNFTYGLIITHGHKYGILSATHNVLFNIPEQYGTYNTSAISSVVTYQNKIEHTTPVPSPVLLCCEGHHFPQT